MNTDKVSAKEGAKAPQNKNKAGLHFRAIDWAATPRPRLHDLLLNLEIAENTGTRYSGVTIWRNGLSFILAGPWLAVPAARLAEAMQSGEVAPENLAAALLPKLGKAGIAAELLDEIALPPETDRTRLLDRLAGNEFSESEIRAIFKFVGNVKGGENAKISYGKFSAGENA